MYVTNFGCVYKCNIQVFGAINGQKRVADYQELELQMVVSRQLGVGK